VHDFLARKGIPVLEHPPYSPDLAPADLWLFPKVKEIVTKPSGTSKENVQQL
jgi:hypothetical protein